MNLTFRFAKSYLVYTCFLKDKNLHSFAPLMRYIKAILLSLVCAGVLAQTFSLLCIYESYTLNKAYIAAHLCENRAMPTMHCNGHCYLSKKLKAEEQNDKQLPNNLNEKISVAPIFCHDDIALLPQPQQHNITANFNYTLLIPAKFLSSPFHPPSLLS
jgi:hypothetical protein